MVSTNNLHKRIPSAVFSVILLVSIFQSTVWAETQQKAQQKTTSWSFLSGYSVSYPGLGRSETRVETVDLLLRYKRLLIKGERSSWYNGNHYILIEPVIQFMTVPSGTPMIGVNILGCYIFPGTDALTTYVLGGGGIVYIDEDIEGAGSKFNANYQFGIGFQIPATTDHSLFFELRYHHISNGDTASDNIPINSFKFLAGFTF